MDERVTLFFRGLMLERFMERALGEGVLFERVERVKKHEAHLITDERGADQLLELARRYALDVRVIQREGAGVVRRWLKRHLALPFALVACAALVFSFLSRVWILEAQMLDESGGEQVLIDAVCAQGIAPGVWARGLDLDALSLGVQAVAPEFSYVSARVQGVRLLVEATRELPAPDVYDPQAARDLVAARDALIDAIDVQAGTAAVKPGDVVRAGQVLIRGEERDGRETTRGVCALGVVTGRVWLTGEADAPLVSLQVYDTGERQTHATLGLLGWSLPLYESGAYDRERTQIEYLPVGGLFLPLKITRLTHIRQAERTVQANEALIKEEISKIALTKALSKLPQGVQPVDKWVDYSMIEGGHIFARAVVEIRMNVAVTRDEII